MYRLAASGRAVLGRQMVAVRMSHRHCPRRKCSSRVQNWLLMRCPRPSCRRELDEAYRKRVAMRTSEGETSRGAHKIADAVRMQAAPLEEKQ